MVKTWLSAIFAVAATVIFILTVSCKHSDPILCTILHPVNYFMVIFLLFVSYACLDKRIV